MGLNDTANDSVVLAPLSSSYIHSNNNRSMTVESLKPELKDDVLKVHSQFPVLLRRHISREIILKEGFDDYIRISNLPQLENTTEDDRELLKLHLLPDREIGRILD